jgi:hypothetical protein
MMRPLLLIWCWPLLLACSESSQVAATDADADATDPTTENNDDGSSESPTNPDADPSPVGGAGPGPSESQPQEPTPNAGGAPATNPGSGGMPSQGNSGEGGAAAANTSGGTSTAGSANAGAASGGTAGVPITASGEDCEPLPAPNSEALYVSPSDDLAALIASAPEGSTLLLADGVYDVSQAEYIAFSTPGVTLRSASGNAEDVIIDGNYEIGSIFNIRADAITIAEVTLQRCQWHPIHVTGGTDADTNDTFIYRVRVIDPGQQAIKINASDGHYADTGTIACSTIELSAEGRENVSDCYTGGIDAHLARGWHIRDNHISGFFCQEGLSEHAIHFWNSGRDTVVERNQIVDCARGIGFGLGAEGNGTARLYDDAPCPGADFVGHYGGVIRNNIVFGSSAALFASASGFDSGIALEQACGTNVVHNTIFAAETPFTSIEYRFANTDVFIANNLTSHQIMERDGGRATLEGNLTDTPASMFVNAANGDLHLAEGAAALEQGAPLEAGLAADDIDREPRGATPDVGADER